MPASHEIEPRDAQRGGADVAGSAAAARILFVASEMHPLARTGGLADVCAALPPALAGAAIDLRLLMPGYPSAFDRALAPRRVADLGEVLGCPCQLHAAIHPDSGLPLWLLDCPPLYRRAGGPYQDADGRDWPDNALRFAVLAAAAARIAAGATPLDWSADVLHCHDWHTGLAPPYLALLGARCRSVFTVHNAAFQGNFPLALAERLGLPAHLTGSDGAEFFGQLSFLKAGVRFADQITTVSPSYARELQTVEFGCGLEGLFRQRARELHGILNGIDRRSWNPATDPHLPARYSRQHPDGKRACKSELQRSLGLVEDPDAPLAIVANRLTEQKMADIVLERLPTLLDRHPRLQFALLGEGERGFERGFVELGRRYAARAAVQIGYQDAAAHRLHAGADILLHGSRFEPCGLVQMYAMRYGAVPIVRRVGGLGDSVVDHGVPATTPATGFVFDQASGDHLEEAIGRSLSVYLEQPQAWMRLRDNAMRADFGWERSAHAYRSLYARLLQRVPTAPSGDFGAELVLGQRRERPQDVEA